MSAMLLERIIVEPKPQATASVIWLHGMGASGHDFNGVLPFLELQSDHAIRFIFPHAGTIPVTMNGGIQMRAWYDIPDLNLTRNQDEPGIQKSSDMVCRLIENEIQAGIPANKIVLMGFSQGAAMALYCGLRYSDPLAGIAMLSGYVVLQQTLQKERNTALNHLPIFIGHGVMDPIVPYELGENAKTVLEGWGYRPRFNRYPMSHMVCMEEMVDVGRWIQSVL